MKFTRRRYLVPAADVRRLREALGLSQTRFACALRVDRRTIIRGEQRGLELPWKPDSTRSDVWEAWAQLQKEAADRHARDRPLNVTGGRT